MEFHDLLKVVICRVSGGVREESDWRQTRPGDYCSEENAHEKGAGYVVHHHQKGERFWEIYKNVCPHVFHPALISTWKLRAVSGYGWYEGGLTRTVNFDLA